MAAVSGRVWPWFLLAVLLSIVDGIARLTYVGRRFVGEAPLAWFNATQEWTVPTCFSALTMGAIAVVCLRRRDAPAAAWRLTGLLFAYLAIDDLFGLHERIGDLVHPWTRDIGIYSWVLTLGPPFAALGLFGAVGLWRAFAGDAVRRVCLAIGFALLALALGCEAAENAAASSSLRWRGLPLIDLAQWLEETLELAGPVFVLAAVLPRRPAAAADADAAAPTVRRAADVRRHHAPIA